MKLNSKSLGALIVIILFGGILLSTALNFWQTESDKIPAVIASGEFAGQNDPGDIRGSYSLGDIAANFPVSVTDLAAAFGLPAEGATEVQVKTLEELYAGLPVEIGTDSVRLFVALWSGLPYEVEDTYLPDSAVQMLNARGGLTGEQETYLAAHTVSLAGAVTSEEPVVALPAEAQAQGDAAQVEPTAEHVPVGDGAGTGDGSGEEEGAFIKGKTTYRELLDWGLPQSEIEAVIGGALPNPLTTVRDDCTKRGIEFAAVKEALQAKLDALPQ